jgi:hypothetical protein
VIDDGQNGTIDGLAEASALGRQVNERNITRHSR